MMRLCAAALCGGLLLLGGCSSTTQIQTSPPRTRETADNPQSEAARQARLTVIFQEGQTNLPEDVESLRFRISEVHLRQLDGEWLRLPSDLHLIELERRGGSVRKAVLDTRVPPARYDSLAILFERVFVGFGANAGGSLTAGKEVPHRMAIDLEPALSGPTSLLLNFEPGASLSRTADCRWFFVPLIRPEIILSSPPSPPGQG